MTRTVRSRGPRRRGKQSTLVRPMPVFNTPPPPIPLAGQIRRMMTPNFIADYEGLATASWTSGVTGNIGTAASSSWNCQYHHVVRSDPRIEYDVILPPVRWEIAAPSTGLGTYDFWNTRSGILQGYIPQGIGTGGGTIGLINKLLPSSHFAEYLNGFAELLQTPFPLPAQTTTAAPNTYREASLQAISAGTQVYGPSLSVAAIRHRVNGTAVGTLTLNPPGNRSVTTAWRFDVSEGDAYSIDVWYRFKMPAQPNVTWPLKACAYIPTSKVSNGSRRVLSTVPFLPLCVWQNINFSPDFNYQEQTYQTTVGGHSGWTLKDGSNGPHKMITGGNWAAGIGNGEIIWKYIPANSYCNAIVYRWNREVPHVEFYPGPLSSVWGGSASSTPVFIYRSTSSVGYLGGSSSTDFGPLTHIDAGNISQAGSTTFSLQMIEDAVPSIISGSYFEPSFPEAFDLVPIFAAAHIPTSITLTRVDQ